MLRIVEPSFVVNGVCVSRLRRCMGALYGSPLCHFNRALMRSLKHGLLMVLLTRCAFAAELPDISSVPPDLTVPEMTDHAAGPGLRVRHTTAGWEKTQVYGALYLPPK